MTPSARAVKGPRREHPGDCPEDDAISRDEEKRVQTEVVQLLAAGLAAEIADELLKLSNRPGQLRHSVHARMSGHLPGAVRTAEPEQAARCGAVGETYRTDEQDGAVSTIARESSYP
jgi:hypothetical protein